MKEIYLFILLFPAVLCGQHQKLHYLNLAVEPMGLGASSFRVIQVADATGVTDGRFGTVYTGLTNNRRDLAFQPNLAVDLTAFFLRNSADRGLPVATFSISFLRIDEETALYGERRRLQLEASLEMTGPDGNPVVYGPRRYSEVTGGLDVTDGHAAALAAALSALVMDLDADVRTGTIPIHGVVTGGQLPNGAYLSFPDYRAGRVDTSITLKLIEQRPARAFDHILFHEAEFERTEVLTRREAREIWGYHHAGTHYLYVENRFLSLETDTRNRILLAVPGGLYDPDATTKRMLAGGLLFGAVGAIVAGVAVDGPVHELYALNLNSGALEPVVPLADSADYRNRILLHHDGVEGDPTVTARINGGEYRLAPGTLLVLDLGGYLELSAGQDVKPLKKKIWRTDDRVALYRVALGENNKFALTRGSQQGADEAARAAGAGYIPFASSTED